MSAPVPGPAVPAVLALAAALVLLVTAAAVLTVLAARRARARAAASVDAVLAALPGPVVGWAAVRGHDGALADARVLTVPDGAPDQTGLALRVGDLLSAAHGDPQAAALREVLARADAAPGTPAGPVEVTTATGRCVHVHALVAGAHLVSWTSDHTDVRAAGQALAEANDLLAGTVEELPQAVLHWTAALDEQDRPVDFTLHYRNPAAARLCTGTLAGLTPGVRATEVDLPEQLRRDLCRMLVRAWASTGPAPIATEVGGSPQAQAGSGAALLHRRTSITAVPARGGVLMVGHDVHERWLAEQDAEASRGQARAVLDRSPSALAVLDRAGRVVQVNDEAVRVLGAPRLKLISSQLLDAVPAQARPALLEQFAALRAGSTEVAVTDVPYEHPNGTPTLLQVAASAVRDAGGGVVWFVAHLQDVTAQNEHAEQLRWEATHDPLTGLGNRALLREQLTASLRAAHGEPRTGEHAEDMAFTGVALVFIDLDGVKQVNDTFGHAAGDELLVQTGARLTALARPEDVVARLGGDEFVVLLAGLRDGEQAHAMAARVEVALAEPFVLAGGVCAHGASVGVALAGARDIAADLLARADEAMYRHKQARYQARASSTAR